MGSDQEFSDYLSEEDVTFTMPSSAGPITKWENFDYNLLYGEDYANQPMEPCEYCGRKFVPNSLERHRFPCYREQEKKRKLSEQQAAKCKNPELEMMHEKFRARRFNRIRSWRIRHLEFVSAVSSAREYKQAKLTGAPLPEPTPILFPNYELRKCETCARRFNEQAYAKHAPRCKEEMMKRDRGHLGKMSTPATPSKPGSAMSLPRSPAMNAAMSRPQSSVNDYLRQQMALLKIEEVQFKASSPAPKVSSSCSQMQSPLLQSRKSRPVSTSCNTPQLNYALGGEKMVDLNTLLQNPALLGQLATIAHQNGALATQSPMMQNQFGQSPIPGGFGYQNMPGMSPMNLMNAMNSMNPMNPMNPMSPMNSGQPPMSYSPWNNREMPGSGSNRATPVMMPGSMDNRGFDIPSSLALQAGDLQRSTMNSAASTSTLKLKFCHECGNKFDSVEIKFCCECGAQRLNET